MFDILRDREWYRTEGFNELACNFVKDESYRKSSEKLNRVRREEAKGGTPTRTLANIVEIEGVKIASKIEEKVEDILIENEFTKEGIPKDIERSYGIKIEDVAIDTAEVKSACESYNKKVEKGFEIKDMQCEKKYIKPKTATNISIDDVSVKKQVEHRKKDEKKDPKRVRNTVTHIENKNEKYYLNGESTAVVLKMIVAFLIHNRLINSFIEYFVDGERTLHNTIAEQFGWYKSYEIILDWYHLVKKCKEELSLALKGKTIRNKILDEITKYLWIGEIGLAKEVLSKIEINDIKSLEHIEKLIGYFERNEKNIPCYALRKELGLRNSSNKGEKANDMIVSKRQKHNGMSWSKCGSTSLATITTLNLNKELHRWFSCGKIDFKLVG